MHQNLAHTRNANAKSLFQAIGVSLALACVLFLSTRAPAQDAGKAKFKVDRSTMPRNIYTWIYKINGTSILEIADGECKEVQFTPDPSGTTTIEHCFSAPNIFGRRTGLQYKMVFKVGPGGSLEHRYKLNNPKDQRDFSVQEIVHNAGIDVSSMKISLNDSKQEQEIASEIVATPKGAKRTVRRSRTIERSVSLTETEGMEAAAKAQFAVLSGELRLKIEKSRNTTYKVSETIEQAVEIDGKELPKAKLSWVEVRVIGTARVSVNGKESVIPFTFRENLELRVTAVK